MKKFLQVLVSVVSVVLVGSGCATAYRYDNSRSTTENVRATGNGGYEKVTSYTNHVSSSSPLFWGQGYIRLGGGSYQEPQYQVYPQYQYNNDCTPVVIAAPAVGGLLPPAPVAAQIQPVVVQIVVTNVIVMPSPAQ